MKRPAAIPDMKYVYGIKTEILAPLDLSFIGFNIIPSYSAFENLYKVYFIFLIKGVSKNFVKIIFSGATIRSRSRFFKCRLELCHYRGK
jgi:hypothetical protein